MGPSMCQGRGRPTIYLGLPFRFADLMPFFTISRGRSGACIPRDRNFLPCSSLYLTKNSVIARVSRVSNGIEDSTGAWDLASTGYATRRSFLCVSPSRVCSHSSTPTKWPSTTHRQGILASLRTRASSGSPSPPSVQGRNPKSSGNTNPTGRTFSARKKPSFPSYFNWVRIPWRSPQRYLRATSAPRRSEAFQEPYASSRTPKGKIRLHQGPCSARVRHTSVNSGQLTQDCWNQRTKLSEQSCEWLTGLRSRLPSWT